MTDISSIFGTLVFDDRVMKERLSDAAYNSIKRTADGRSPKLIIENRALADEIADAMKEWATEHGATHYTHWFQPLNGVTAEKHDSFVTPDGCGGALITFSGKELIRGESDASSFPSGGLRSTFEASGYTAWDPTFYAFIKDKTLCIPTVFCSYGGEALDKKTPLMRSCQALSAQGVRLLRLLGDDETNRIIVNAGAEQEYFLIDKALYDLRTDLKFTGCTLIGARPPKGQELDDHYYGAIKPRVQEFMNELNIELWKLGICAKTEHNEVAPSQHELAPIYTSVNIATDQNQLTMEMMKRVALRHGFVCVLHEKPFEGMSGSGKHNNWSIATDKGQNLLDPGQTPADNVKFMLFLCAVIKGVDEYQDLLRISIAAAENDNRLGRSEAPPAIISMFLGDELMGVLDSLLSGEKFASHEALPLETHVHVLPKLPRDSTDRNRTSPLAFTGNKFEFRMPGSSASIADPNTVLNTITADALRVFADRIEASSDRTAEINAILRETVSTHGRIIFNGNNYTDEWVAEAEKRGLLNLRTTPEAVCHFKDKKNIDLFTKHRIFTEGEILSRTEILLENYSKVINIEALTMLEMAKKEILPSVFAYTGDVAKGTRAKAEIGIDDPAAKKNVQALCKLSDSFGKGIEKLEKLVLSASEIKDAQKNADFLCEKVVPAMNDLRSIGDKMETMVGEKYWSIPTYDELLYGVN